MNAIFVAVGAVLLSAGLVYSGNGLLSIVLPLRGVAEMFPTPVLGLLGTAFALGFVSGCLYAPLIIRRVGHIRAFAIFAAIAANSVLFYELAPHPLAWLLLRVANGYAMAGLIMVVESWLNERADNANRGRILGAYLIVNYVAATGGQMTASLGDPKTFTLFAWAAIGLCAALIPVAMTTVISPAPITQVRIRIGQILTVSPVGAAGAAVTGVFAGAFGTMGAVFVSRLGFSTFEIALFASAAVIGAAFMQVPAGYLSDRIDRRLVIIALSITSALIGLWMVASDREGPVDPLMAMIDLGSATSWILASLAYGAFAYPIYGVSLAHMNDFVEQEGFVEASSSFLLLWSIGAAIGPFAASLAMQAFRPNALFLATAIAHGALAVFAVYRMTRRASVPASEKSAWVPDTVARTTPEAMLLDPRSVAAEEHD